MTHFKELAKKAIRLFHLQNVKGFIIPYRERSAFAVKLFNELDEALSEDKELTMYYGSKANPVKVNEIEKVVNEIKANVIPKSDKDVNLWNKHFWAKNEVEKQTIQSQGNKLIQQLIDENNNILNRQKAKIYCISIYAKLHKMKYNYKTGYVYNLLLVNPLNNLEFNGSYATPTDVKIMTLDKMKFKKKHLNQIANHLENNEIEEANTIFNEQRKRIKKKSIENKGTEISYPNHKHKSNAMTKFKRLPPNTFPFNYIAFFGPDVGDPKYKNEPIVYSIIVDAIRNYTAKKQNNEPTTQTTPETPTGGKGKDNETSILQRWKDALLGIDNAKLKVCLFIESGLFKELTINTQKHSAENLAKNICPYFFTEYKSNYKNIINDRNKASSSNYPSTTELKEEAEDLIKKHKLQDIKLADLKSNDKK